MHKHTDTLSFKFAWFKFKDKSSPNMASELQHGPYCARSFAETGSTSPAQLLKVPL
uniref:Uncharacterized protein n=1 Tax=Anguilla anguilla TaxID=7936 RepID=A0A0E9U8C2_ANGAN